MRTIALLAAAAVAMTPSLAYPCLNETQRTVDEVWLVQRAEKQFEAGEYTGVRKTLGSHRFKDARLRDRSHDVLAVTRIRARKQDDDLKSAIEHFKSRSIAKAGKTDVRYQQWLAEAYFATGKLDDARTLLADLHRRDLMPDEFGYLALAKLTAGEERYAAWKACRTKARKKSICELPAEVARRK